jgi:hypothetical protein
LPVALPPTRKFTDEEGNKNKTAGTKHFVPALF